MNSAAAERLVLANERVRLALALHGIARRELEWVEQFLAPQFSSVNDGPVDLTIDLRPLSDANPAWFSACTDNLTMRASSAREFNLVGRQGVLADGTRFVFDETHRTGYRIGRSENSVELFWSEHSKIHLIELIRYSALLLEEARGAVLFHASAASNAAGCHLVVGEKGAGKTTTLLHLIVEHGLRHFSGDKVLLSGEGSRIVARGWPDYPHVGIGTLARFPAIARAAAVPLTDEFGTPRSPGDKELIEPTLFRRVLGGAACGTLPIRTIVFPAVRSKHALFRVVPDSEKDPRKLALHIEYPHEFVTARWHGLLGSTCLSARPNVDALLTQLTRARWLEVHGDAHIPAHVLEEASPDHRELGAVSA